MIRKRGSVFYTDFELPNGKRVRKSTGTSDMVKATAFAVALHGRMVEEGKPEAVDAGRKSLGMPLSSLMKHVYNERWAHLRNKWKWSHIKTALEVFGADTPLHSVTRETFKAALATMRAAGYSASTIAAYMGSVHVAMTHAAEEWGLQLTIPKLPKNPISNAKTRYLNESERAALVAAETNPHYRVLWMFLMDSGVRVGDAWRAEWSAFDLNPKVGTYYNPNSKPGRPHNIPLQPDTIAELTALKEQRPDSKLVFPFRYHIVNHWFKGTRTRAGLGDDVTLHTLRHTCATMLLEQGADLVEVRDWLGHANVQTTSRYAKVVPQRLFALRNKIAAAKVAAGVTESSQHQQLV